MESLSQPIHKKPIGLAPLASATHPSPLPPYCHGLDSKFFLIVEVFVYSLSSCSTVLSCNALDPHISTLGEGGIGQEWKPEEHQYLGFVSKA